jgi:transposase
LKNFVQIPHARFISLIQYKAKLQGVEVILTEESYTTKIDHLNYEVMEKQDEYL